MIFIFLLITSLFSLVAITSAQPQQITCSAGTSIQFATCFRLLVPLDHANPQTTIKIPIQYGIVFPTVPVASKTAFLYLPGGPGEAGLTSRILNVSTKSLADNLRKPVVMVDPRGSGPLSRLSCNNQAMQSFSETEFLSIRRDCLLQAGSEIIHYSTNQVIEDLEDIRRAIGVEQFDVLGVSYGTVTSQFYSRRYPNRIRIMVLDSPVPFLRDIYSTRYPAAYRRIYRRKNQANLLFNINTVNANTATVLNRLRNSTRLQAQIGITPQAMQGFYRSTSNTFINAIASAAVLNDYAPLIQFTRVSNISPFVLNQVTLVAVYCNDVVNAVPWKPTDGFNARLTSLVADVAREVPSNQYFPFTQFEGLTTILSCIAFPFVQVRREGIPVLPPRLIPTLVIYGEIDQITPVEERTLLDPFIQSKVAVIRGAGHAVSFRNSSVCGQTLIANFLLSGSVANFNACA